MTNLEQATGRLTRGDGTLGKLLTDSSCTTGSTSMTRRLDEVVGGLNSGRGHGRPVAARPAAL